MKNTLSYEIIGWCGTIVIIIAYFLISQKIIENGVLYNILNFVGGVSLVIICVLKKAYQPVILNIIWATIALLAII